MANYRDVVDAVAQLPPSLREVWYPIISDMSKDGCFGKKFPPRTPDDVLDEVAGILANRKDQRQQKVYEAIYGLMQGDATREFVDRLKTNVEMLEEELQETEQLRKETQAMNDLPE